MKNPFKNSDEDELKVDLEKKSEENDTLDVKKEEDTDKDIKSCDSEVIADESKQDESKNDENVCKSKSDEKYTKLEEKYNQLNNQYIRLAADFENFRKRQESEKEALLKYGAETTLKKMIEVLDNFERGLKALETVEDCEKVKECYNLAYKNFTEALKKAGLETIKAEGEEFDPNFHEAVMQTPTSEKAENTVVAELQKGYKLGDKVLRPSLVNVAVAE